jgi:hypothetical protein
VILFFEYLAVGVNCWYNFLMSPDFPNTKEIDAALKEYEAQKAGGRIVPAKGGENSFSAGEIESALQKFNQTETTDPRFSNRAADAPPISELSAMTRLVIKLSGGLIKEKKQAEYVLLGFAIVTIGASLFLFFRGASQNEPPIKRDYIQPTAI